MKNKISALHSARSRGIKINIGKQIIKLEEEKAFFNFKVTDLKGKMTLDLQGQNEQI